MSDADDALAKENLISHVGFTPEELNLFVLKNRWPIAYPIVQVTTKVSTRESRGMN